MNVKSTEQQAAILRCLVEGNSIRSTVRITGAAKNTVIRLLERVGEACQAYQDEHLCDLLCTNIQIDEIWSFIERKDKNAKGKTGGSIWTWTALCRDTKLAVSWLVGNRSATSCNAFCMDLASRLKQRPQITSDGFHSYPDAIENAFGPNVDYAMMEKHYGTKPGDKRKQYIGATKQILSGSPDPTQVSTSHVERANLTMRMGIRRFTRKTNAFSKKAENHMHAISLHFMYYNFARIHKSLRVSPAMAAGITDKLWDLDDIVKITDEYWAAKETVHEVMQNVS